MRYYNAKCVISEEFWQQNLGYMQERNLDDIMNGIVKEKLGIIPEDLVWGGTANKTIKQSQINIFVT